jgi:hypothetical protein
MNWKFEGLVSNYQTWTLRNKNGGVLFTVYRGEITLVDRR